MLCNICYITSKPRLYIIKYRGFCYDTIFMWNNIKVCYIAHPNLPSPDGCSLATAGQGGCWVGTSSWSHCPRIGSGCSCDCQQQAIVKHGLSFKESRHTASKEGMAQGKIKLVINRSESTRDEQRWLEVSVSERKILTIVVLTCPRGWAAHCYIGKGLLFNFIAQA